MSTVHFNNWIQILTSIAVLAGLGLVIWELRQARTLTQVELSQHTMSDITQDFSSLYGDQGAEALTRACFFPDKMTETDAVILDFFFWNQTYRARRLKLQVDVAGFNPRWKRAAEFSAKYIAGYPQGKKWLRKFESTDAELQAVFRDSADKAEIPSCNERFHVLLPSVGT